MNEIQTKNGTNIVQELDERLRLLETRVRGPEEDVHVRGGFSISEELLQLVARVSKIEADVSGYVLEHVREKNERICVFTVPGA